MSYCKVCGKLMKKKKEYKTCLACDGTGIGRKEIGLTYPAWKDCKCPDCKGHGQIATGKFWYECSDHACGHKEYPEDFKPEHPENPLCMCGGCTPTRRIEVRPKRRFRLMIVRGMGKE